jgi:hypothetical protein
MFLQVVTPHDLPIYNKNESIIANTFALYYLSITNKKIVMHYYNVNALV